MKGLEQIGEMLQLMAIKKITESMGSVVEEALKTILAQKGIEADVNISINVTSVNLDTFTEDDEEEKKEEKEVDSLEALSDLLKILGGGKK